MRKIQTLVLALVSVLAINAAIAAVANAEFLLAEWLINGTSFTAELPGDSIGEILLENTSNGAALQCSGLFEVVFMPPSDLLILKLFSLTGVEIPETGKLVCKTLKICEEVTDTPEVTPLKLPWLTEVELEEPGGKFISLILFGEGTNLPTYSIKCLVATLAITEECTAANEGAAELLNVAGGVEVSSAKPVEPLGECGGKAGVALQQAIAGNLLTSGEGTVSVSE